MGIGIVVLFWIVIAIVIVIPIASLRLWFLFRSKTKTGAQKKRGAWRTGGFGCAFIVLIGFWIPIAIGIHALTDTHESRFEMIFGVEPPEGLQFIESDSGYSSDFTGAYVRFQMPIDELRLILPPTFAPSDADNLPHYRDWHFSRKCPGMEAFQEEPWRQYKFASSSAAVTYCPDTETVIAIASGVD